jgi:hypothetical protein
MCTCGHRHPPVLSEKYLIPDSLWFETAKLLPLARPQKTHGRQRMNDRQMLTAISGQAASEKADVFDLTFELSPWLCLL